MNSTPLFGLIKIFTSIILFVIFGISLAKMLHQTTFSQKVNFGGVVYNSFIMGLIDLFEGLYYIHQDIIISPIILSVIYGCIPFSYHAFFVFAYKYAFPEKSIRKYNILLLLVPIISLILSFTNKYQHLYVSFSGHFSQYVFTELDLSLGFWIIIISIFNIVMLVLTFYSLIHAFVKQKQLKRGFILIVLLIILTLVINSTVLFNESILIHYLDLMFGLLFIVSMYITINFDNAEYVIYKCQKDIIDKNPYPIVIYDKFERILYANKEATNSFSNIGNYIKSNIYAEDLLKQFSQFNKNDLPLSINNINDKVIINNETHELNCVKKFSIVNRKQSVIGLITMFINIRTVQKLLNTLKSLALVDKLTGFYNRNYFEITKGNLKCNFDNSPFTIILCDINNLKLINDNLGHENGDSYILLCCSIIKKYIRTDDIVIRTGGDEFIILLPNTCNERGLEIANLISNCNNFNINKNISSIKSKLLGIATGVATNISGEFNFDELVKKADSNMYLKKKKMKESQ